MFNKKINKTVNQIKVKMPQINLMEFNKITTYKVKMKIPNRQRNKMYQTKTKIKPMNCSQIKVKLTQINLVEINKITPYKVKMKVKSACKEKNNKYLNSLINRRLNNKLK